MGPGFLGNDVSQGLVSYSHSLGELAESLAVFKLS